MNVVIIDYGSGNLHSAAKSFERANVEADLGFEIKVTSHPDDVIKADRIVLPGVGAYGDCLAGLDALDGMHEALEESVHKQAKPFLGICVGMQLMSERGLEHGVSKGFGWIEGEVGAIEPSDPSLKIPHMGWNTIELLKPHPVFEGIPTGDDGLHAYFVHSYHFRTTRPEDRIATTEHGGTVTAAVARDTMIGTQFHPEKSQKLGLKLIENFLRWKP
ncbi:MAG: imidazole glycerol phosphate synthase subunit HisH [Methyloligellaceae bacterium]